MPVSAPRQSACCFTREAARAQQNYPSRPIRLVIPFGAGGVAVITSRLVAENLGEKLGQRIVIENQPGAGGVTAALGAGVCA